MIELDRPLTDQWVGAFVHDSCISWIARNNTKPGRVAERELVLMHATPDWTAQHWDDPVEQVVAELTEELRRCTNSQPQQPISATGHRWKYAIDPEPLHAGAHYDRELGLALCGDWVAGSRVEGAFLSGMAAAGQILGSLPTSSGNRPGYLFEL